MLNCPSSLLSNELNWWRWIGPFEDFYRLLPDLLNCTVSGLGMTGYKPVTLPVTYNFDTFHSDSTLKLAYSEKLIRSVVL
jgi:hypothetical protein